MRPTTGPKLTPDNILAAVDGYRRAGYSISPKLNGDRGILESTAAGLKLWNRYGTLYGASQIDLHYWRVLRPGTILDGECVTGGFHPFGCLADEHGDLTMQSEATRILRAQSICLELGNAWLFDEPSDEWLIEQVNIKTNRLTRRWEGVVCKVSSARYSPLKTAEQESPTWTKLRWC